MNNSHWMPFLTKIVNLEGQTMSMYWPLSSNDLLTGSKAGLVKIMQNWHYLKSFICLPHYRGSMAFHGIRIKAIREMNIHGATGRISLKECVCHHRQRNSVRQFMGHKHRQYTNTCINNTRQRAFSTNSEMASQQGWQTTILKMLSASFRPRY